MTQAIVMAGLDETRSSEIEAIADEIRSHAAIASRAGQMAELEKLADRLVALVTEATDPSSAVL